MKFWIFYVFGSYFRTLTVILVSDLLLFLFFREMFFKFENWRIFSAFLLTTTNQKVQQDTQRCRQTDGENLKQKNSQSMNMSCSLKGLGQWVISVWKVALFIIIIIIYFTASTTVTWALNTVQINKCNKTHISLLLKLA